jgi:hypothetical protein
MAKCAACQARKGKRSCPALAGRICSPCCGTKRGKEIDCPAQCPFLGAAKQYRSRREEGRRLEAFEKELRSIIGNETAYQGVLHNIEFMIYRSYRRRGGFCDADVAAALGHILESGKARLNLPAAELPAPSPEASKIIRLVNDVVGFKAALSGREAQGIDALKCVYRVLDSVKTHADPDNPYSYLDFIGSTVGD